MKNHYLSFVLLFGLLLSLATSAEAKTGSLAAPSSEMTALTGHYDGIALTTETTIEAADLQVIRFDDCVFEFEGELGGKKFKVKVTVHGMSCTQFFKTLSTAVK